MNELEKMNVAIKYIVECKWTRNSVDCFGDNLTIGVDMDTAYLIRDLSLFIGKAQVYKDQNNLANCEFMIKGFWNLFTEEDFDFDDFRDWLETFSTEEL